MVYDILPERDLHYSDIRDTLNANGGSVNNNVASAFATAANINMWANYKPFIYKSNFVEKDVMDSTTGVGSGFSYSEIKYHNNITYRTFVYNLPTGGENAPYRLGDFRGYNSNAKTPSIDRANVSFEGAPSGVNGYKGTDDDEVEVYLDIQYPDISPSKIPLNDLYPEEQFKMVLYAIDGNVRKVLYQQAYTSIAAFESKKNKKETLTILQDFNLPQPGDISETTIYMNIGGGEVSSCVSKIYAQWTQDITNPNNWLITSYTVANPEYNNTLGMQQLRYLKAINPTDKFGLKITNMYSLINNPLDVFYLQAQKSDGTWVDIVSFTNDTVAKPSLLNGTTGLDGGLIWDDYTFTPSGTSSPVTIKAISGMIELSKSVFPNDANGYRMRNLRG